LDEIEEQGDEQVPIAEYRRQRWIVEFDEPAAGRKSALGNPPRVLEDAMNVDGAPLDRSIAGEHLHAIDQRHDAVGFLTDQAGKFRIARRGAALEQLSRTADT